MRPGTLLAALVVLSALLAPAPALDGFPDAEAWTARFADRRQVVDQVVVCFDAPTFLREISAWDEERYWPVLLWDSRLVPKFVTAFRPAQVVLARFDEEDETTLGEGLAAVLASWGAGTGDTGTAAFLARLKSLGRAPLGAVLLGEGAPETLGGLALAAGRFQLPLVFPAAKGHGEVISFEEKEEIRRGLAAALAATGAAFDAKFDDLDFVTVANDLPFGYRPPPDGSHPGGYTVDDAIARGDDLARWGWVGRLAGGRTRSVYAAMASLFLRPGRGMFFSRYDPADPSFGAFDPLPALEPMKAFLEPETIRHPDATLDRWREAMWPRGNLFDFLYVNSSGGATSWSTSRGGATHFDVPDSVAAVVHYTHSGSAGRPFDVDTIAGRWMDNGAYVYFGSYAEPYLGAFVPPSALAERVAAGVPLGAAMRHLYEPRAAASRPMKIGEEERTVRFNMTGPWKLAYFGDPLCRLVPEAPGRLPSPGPGEGHYKSFNHYEKARPRDPAARERHALAHIGLPLIDPEAPDPVEERTWGKLLKEAGGEEEAMRLQREFVRAWVTALRRAPREELYEKRSLRKLADLPSPIVASATVGGNDPEAARLLTELAKEVVAGIPLFPDTDVGKEPALAVWVLETACCFEHSGGSAARFYGWVGQVCDELGIDKEALRDRIEQRDWVTKSARVEMRKHLK